MAVWYMLHPETGVALGAVDTVYTGTALPTPSAVYHRSVFIMTQDDDSEVAYMCVKDAGGTYGWQFLSGGRAD